MKIQGPMAGMLAQQALSATSDYEGNATKKVDAGGSYQANGVTKSDAEVAREFEAFLVGFVFDIASKSIPKNGFLNGGLGEEMYNSLFIQELAGKTSSSSRGFGIAEQILAQASRGEKIGNKA